MCRLVFVGSAVGSSFGLATGAVVGSAGRSEFGVAIGIAVRSSDGSLISAWLDLQLTLHLGVMLLSLVYRLLVC